MTSTFPSDPRIAVIGLGYVGLPLAVALARRFRVAGYDSDLARVAELRRAEDRTGEVSAERLKATSLRLADNAESTRGCDLFIITVPTPVDAENAPDLSAVRRACGAVGGVLGAGAVVVLESTVYPGVTEEVCGPALAEASGLAAGVDFHLGYSPERMNPGDPAHGVESISKVVAGGTPAVAAFLAHVYGAINEGDVFIAASIRVAEAAKVIENTQRDINIAFVNEVARIFHRQGIRIHDVLEAARTKWNFLPFEPGLVGGHCIGVDPFYLAHFAEEAGHHPEIVLAGRRLNDSMGAFLADAIAEALAAANGARVLVLGLTFKEDVPDLRNSKVVDLVRGLEHHGLTVDLHDPLADAAEAERLYAIRPIGALSRAEGYDCLVGAVPHRAYRDFTADDFARLIRQGGMIADVKGMWREAELPDGARRWEI